MEQRDRLLGRRILLGVTGSIAAYKAVELVRRLKDRGAEVRVAMTKNAASFVSRLTFETLSGLPVLCEEFAHEGRPAIGHIEITNGLDLALIAPATANIIGKLAAGIADDSLTTALMASKCPLMIAPAMNERMYRNPVLRRNIDTLSRLGVKFIEPECGSLACGVIGEGRLAETVSGWRFRFATTSWASGAGRKRQGSHRAMISDGERRHCLLSTLWNGRPPLSVMSLCLATAQAVAPWRKTKCIACWKSSSRLVRWMRHSV